MKAIACGILAVTLALACSGPVFAQDGKSSALAKQLAAALEAGKLDSVAAKDPANPDTYIGALYLPGLQILAISAKYSAPQLLDARLAKKEYRDVYVELNLAGEAASRAFVEDLGCDGVKAKPEDRGPDSFESAGKRTTFDGDWKKQKVSEEDYMKASAAADQRYSDMLSALLAQLKKTS